MARPFIIHRSTFIVLALVVGAQACFSWALVAQHRAYNSSAFDLGFFDQIIWNTAHGRWFETTFVRYSFAGQHVEPVLLLFAAVYRVRPDPEILLVAQAAVAAWAAAPLYLGVRRALGSERAGVMAAAAYLLSSSLHGAVRFDFHPEVMGTAAVFGAYALLVAGRPGWALAAIAALFLLKEDAALAGIGFALIVWLAGYRREALALAGGSMLYLVLVVGVVMPAIRGGPGDLQERYGYLGTDARGVAVGALTHPSVVLDHLLGAHQRGGLALLLGTMALLPLLTPASLAALPALAANLLSTHPQQNGLELHYVILPFALLMMAVVTLPARLRALLPWAKAEGWIALLLAAEVAGWLVFSPFGPRRFDLDHYRQTPHTAVVSHVLRAVPAEVPLSAQSGLLPHLSQRRHVWEFPRLEVAEYVVVDRRGWHSSQSDDAGYGRTLAALPSMGYCLVMAVDGVELYERRPACASP